MNQLVNACKAIQYLGLTKLWHYTLYQVGLRTGHYSRATPNRRSDYQGTPSLPPFTSFPKPSPTHRSLTLSQADEVRRGFIRLFGGEPVSLDLETDASDKHWTILEKLPPDSDIKFIWEPARFGWAVTLARAYAFSGDPVYAQDFWDKTLHFLASHPPNLGRQWSSAQEVAIRLIVLIFCDRVFASAAPSSSENRRRLWQAIAEHAQRIPPTLVYARAQNNNHLLSEATCLTIAGLYLADHPQAQQWRQIGWRWLNWGFQHQINESGTYIQHSVNYHRMMLQLALAVNQLLQISGEPGFPLATLDRLQSATRWLWALTDPSTGRAPNLGANDSAYILPLTALPIDDFRPVVNAAARAFLHKDIYNHSDLNEMGDWFGLTAPDASPEQQPYAPDMLSIRNEQGRAFLHTAHFVDRPSHADQLHVDLWYRGINIATDAGTYQYNAAPPWENALATTRVHNTLTLDNQDQMLRAGRFLWLDWAQAEILSYETNENGELKKLTAEHNGYKRLGVLHQRTLIADHQGWLVEDLLAPYGKPDSRVHQASLTWNLPDWVWRLEAGNVLILDGDTFSLKLQIDGGDPLSLIRAGICLHGERTPEPTWGWRSPVYGVKEPALMVIVNHTGKLPIRFTSIWRLED